MENENLKILFIGNSKTYRQNFPRIFEKIVINSGRKIYIDKVTKPGASLAELSAIQETMYKIKSERWDFVVLQERTIKALQDDISQFEQGVNRICKEINENCKATKIVFNVVWVSNDYSREEQNKTNKHYEQIAKKTNSILSYSGNCFLEFHKKFPDIELYEDEKHPSLAGAYLSACCLYNTIYKQQSKEIKYYDILNQKIAKELQIVADKIVKV